MPTFSFGCGYELPRLFVVPNQEKHKGLPQIVEEICGKRKSNEAIFLLTERLIEARVVCFDEGPRGKRVQITSLRPKKNELLSTGQSSFFLFLTPELIYDRIIQRKWNGGFYVR